MKRIHVYIHGVVQGVYFRANIQTKAVELDITGFVRNTDGGEVEAVFEGEDDDIEEMLEFCHEGPRRAKVADMDVEDEEFTGDFDNFEIRY